MKKNIIYLVGIALCAIGLLSGCDEDLPSYVELAVDVETLTINLDETTEGSFSIVEGNGGYKVSSSDAAIATAIISGNEVIVTGLEYGTATLTVTDWTKKSASVKVVIAQEQDLAIKTSSITMFFEEHKTTEIYTGNGGYSITSSNESVATAKISEDGKIEITSSTVPGTTTLTVTDRCNKTAEIAVKVIKRLVVDNSEDIPYLIISEPATIKILDGNGGYKCNINGTAYAAKSLSYEISEDGTEITITGVKRYRFNNTVTILDKEGQSVDIHITYIDEPYLEQKAYNYFLKTSTLATSYQSLGSSKVGKVIYSEELNTSQIIAKTSTTATSGGYAVEFSGNLEVGEKSNATMYKVTKGAVDKKTPFAITDCRIDKVEDGWYWVSFLQEGCTLRSYIIIKAD